MRNMSLTTRPRLTEFATIGLVSASMLMHQILLTRVCALRLQFHFAFLVISNCLLGLGAAGSLLSVHQARFRLKPRVWLGRFALAYVASLIVTYLLLLITPLPRDIELSRIDHVLELCAFNLVGAIPFFFSGLVIGLLLSVHAADSDRLYAVDLLCASLGCIACPLLLPALGAGGVFVIGSMLAVAAAMCAAREEFAKPVLVGGALLLAFGVVSAPRLDRWLPVPSKPADDAAHAQAPGKVRSVWTANSRIDVTLSEGCVAPFFMLGSKPHVPRPRECRDISQDATAATTISDFTGEPAARELLRRSMYSAAYRLKQEPKVLIIGLGGGNDAWAAKINGARSIRAIELNWPIVDIHRHVLRSFSRDLIEDPNVELVVDEGRSALMRESAHYDVIQMTGIDTWTALASGAYVLAENYLYTREAIASMWERLEPDGILQISRFAQTMEALRLLSNTYAALARLGVPDLESSLIIQTTPDHMLAMQVKKGRFTAEEQQSVVAFAEENGLTIEYLPSRPGSGLLDRFIRTQHKQAMIDSFPQNIAPTEDDQPYFFNFTRWDHPIDSIRRIGDIPVISQGNPFFLLTQLLISILLSIALILFPLLRGSGLPKAGTGRILMFFSALGIGYISIEIAVIQKLTLLLGQPVYSLTVTLFSLLLFTGLGSLRVARLVRPHTRSARVVPFLIAIYIGLINLCSPLVVAWLIAAALPIRMLACVLLLAPLGLLLGIPFAYGLRVTHEHEPQLTPWAWAVNGCLSVVGSILSVVVSMNFGFSAVLWLAALIYLAGFAALNSLPPAAARH
jgi:spermidine synthase